MTNRLWVTQFFISPRQFHQYHPITNSKWVAVICLCHVISSHLIPYPTECEWHCPIFLPSNPITSYHMTNRKSAFSLLAILILLPHNKQFVSETSLFSVRQSHHTYPMTNRMWITLPFFHASHSYDMSSHDQQYVSGITLLWQVIPSHHQHSPVCEFCSTASNFFASDPIINSKWATLPPFSARQAVPSHLIPDLIGCEWHHHLLLPDDSIIIQSQQDVSDTTPLCSHFISSQQDVCGTAIVFFRQFNHIAFHYQLDSEWVYLCFAIARQSHYITTSHCISWSTAGECFTSFLFFQAVSLRFITWPTACEWHLFFFSEVSFHTNSK